MNNKITKVNLIKQVARRSKHKIKTVDEIFNAIFDLIGDSIKDGKEVLLTGFGKFYLQEHKGHFVRTKIRGSKDKTVNKIDDYVVLKFASSDTLNKNIRKTVKKQ